MLGIIICEDNEYQRKQVEDIISEEISNYNEELLLDLSTGNPREVINYVKSNGSRNYLYFLDVGLNAEINGIELAKIIRKYDPKGYIVFVTSHVELSFLTFQYKVQALDYILKGDLRNLRKRINECIYEASRDYQTINKKEKNVISINLGYKITNFNFNDILFFETTNIDHKLRIHTHEGHYEFYGKLKDIEGKVSSDYYRAHRAYLVNTTKIKSIDKQNNIIHMTNDETCYVSDRYIKGLIKKCLL